MSKGRYLVQKKKRVPLWLLLILLALLVIAAVLLFGGKDDIIFNDEKNDPAYQTEGSGQTVTPNSGSEDVNPESSPAPDGTEEAEDPAATEDAKKETGDPIEETQGTQSSATQPTSPIVQRVEAEYEKWLAASMVVCVSMEYPDFQLEGIYTESSTALDDKFASGGVYVVFSSGGTRMAIHSKALAQERTERGTVDISTEIIGFATFDKVDPASVTASSMDQISLDHLSKLIEQSLLVSIYFH